MFYRALFYLLLFPVLLLSVSTAQQITRLDKSTLTGAALNEKVQSLLAGARVQGLAISVFNNNKPVYKKTFGYKRADTRLLLNNKTNFYGASLIKLNSNVSFLNKVKLREALDEVPEYSVLTIDGSECNFIDYDILEIISELQNKAHDRHIELHLPGIEVVNVSAVH